jgi:hypothetical protein
LYLPVLIWYLFDMRYASAPSSPGSIPRKVGPPSPLGASSIPGAADRSIRRTARQRPLITPALIAADPEHYPITHPYVRRFWVSLLGPGAVADLCRLAAAARRGRPLKLPTHIDELARCGLVERSSPGRVGVADRIRGLHPHEVRRLPPPLRLEHRRLRSSHPAWDDVTGGAKPMGRRTVGAIGGI